MIKIIKNFIYLKNIMKTIILIAILSFFVQGSYI